MHLPAEKLVRVSGVIGRGLAVSICLAAKLFYCGFQIGKMAGRGGGTLVWQLVGYFLGGRRGWDRVALVMDMFGKYRFFGTSYV